MNPELDRQPARNPWPFPLDGPTERARKVGMMYRSRLRALAPAACDEADTTAASFGEDWMLAREVTVEPTTAVTTSEAAELIGVHVDTIRQWACTEHPQKPGDKLLPRFGRRGRERTYLAKHVYEARDSVELDRRARSAT